MAFNPSRIKARFLPTLPSTAVRYDVAQTLTSTQQALARNNIGVDIVALAARDLTVATANVIKYVRSGGSNVNSGDSADQAYETIEWAFYSITGGYDLNGFAGIIDVGTGTFTAPFLFGPARMGTIVIHGADGVGGTVLSGLTTVQYCRPIVFENLAMTSGHTSLSLLAVESTVGLGNGLIFYDNVTHHIDATQHSLLQPASSCGTWTVGDGFTELTFSDSGTPPTAFVSMEDFSLWEDFNGVSITIDGNQTVSECLWAGYMGSIRLEAGATTTGDTVTGLAAVAAPFGFINVASGSLPGSGFVVSPNGELVAAPGAVVRPAAAVQTSTTYTIGDVEASVVFNAAGTVTVTLPTASVNTGREIKIKTIAAQAVVSASSNVKPLTSNTAGTAILAATAGKYATLQSDGANWVIMEAN